MKDLGSFLAGFAALMTATLGLYLALEPRFRDGDPSDGPTVASEEEDAAPAIEEEPELSQDVDPSPLGVSVVDAMFTVDPSLYVGPCPMLVELVGDISTEGGSGAIKYGFMFLDLPNETRWVDVDAPGVQRVFQEFQIDESYIGYVRLRIWSPEDFWTTEQRLRVECE